MDEEQLSFNEGEITWVEIGNAIDSGEPVELVKGIGFLCTEAVIMRDGKKTNKKQEIVYTAKKP